jgi:hypothetical protein
MVGSETRVLEARGERTQSTFHRRPVIYNDSTANRAGAPHSRGVDGGQDASRRPLMHLGRSETPACGCLYTLRPFQGATRQSEDFQEFGAGLSVSVPGSPAVHCPAALAPTGCGGAQNLDACDHPVAQFHPEFLKQAHTEQPQLRCPGG